jgi:hypothetical protein
MGSDQGKRSPVRPPFFNILKPGVFCQTDDFIVPPKLGEISLYREYRYFKGGGSCPDLLPDDQQVAFNEVLNKNYLGLDWQTEGTIGGNYRRRMGQTTEGQILSTLVQVIPDTFFVMLSGFPAP